MTAQTTESATADQGGAPATSKVQLHENPAKMSPQEARAEARKLRATEKWTVAELKRRYGTRFSTSWLDGIPAPLPGNGDKAPAKESPEDRADRQKAKAIRDADDAAQRKAEQDLTGQPTGGKKQGSKAPVRRTTSKAAAAREAVAKARAAKEATDAAAKAKTPKATGKPKAKATSQPATDGDRKGTGVSGKTMGYKAPIHENAVRLVRHLYGTAKKAEIIAAVAAEFGVEINGQTVDKIGKRVSRKSVSDDGPRTNPDKPTTQAAKGTATKPRTRKAKS